MIVLDTNVLSEMLKPTPDERVFQWFEEQTTQELHITSTIVAELLFGVERMPDGQRKRDLRNAAERLLGWIPTETLPFDEAAARVYGQMAAYRESIGRIIESEDGQIAAICRHRGMMLATRNMRDFAGTGIDLVNPWDAA